MNSLAVVFGNTCPHLCVIAVLVTETLEQHKSIQRTVKLLYSHRVEYIQSLKRMTSVSLNIDNEDGQDSLSRGKKQVHYIYIYQNTHLYKQKNNLLICSYRHRK